VNFGKIAATFAFGKNTEFWEKQQLQELMMMMKIWYGKCFEYTLYWYRKILIKPNPP